ncbi:efflux RND transporter periplasmic adaptor subunit [Mucilaginibacter gotjawali]|uniref:HlyD family secretion protein n=2 Tax=Mucilaginibacter gotjawali TaxID=1550579 RepID=A0A839SFM7_9SPHI|nr:HlyD family efflux transporter periplasmic adaptor subunit [Mucilaginibacter gotjawali]MBB3055670.1 HlyD family secretion protein [Mucilaginibacter gotjawali]BAU54489.1 putative efflux pump membrane fusion protein [Mucilaginibacter gotjawali]
MDRKIEKKTWNTKRILMITGIAAGVILLTWMILTTVGGKSKLDVDTDRLTISEIKKGPFQEFIPINGTVLPLTTIYLDASDGGRVEEKYVEDGAILKKGQPILRLSDPDLELQLAGQQTNVTGQQIQMQIAQNQAQQNTITKLQNMADVESSFKEAERLYKLDKELYAKKAIGLQDYQIAKNAYDYQTEKRRLTKQILSQDTMLVKQSVSQAKQQIAQMKQALTVMQEKVADLTVRAPVDGQLTSLDAEVGQSKTKGEHLAQIDVLSGFKVQAQVEEHYISRVIPGLTAYYVDNDNNTFKLVVKKVYTQVTNGQFNVDMLFVGAVPKGIRKGQTLQIRLVFSDPVPALLLPKGGFFQQTGGNWIFKLAADGKTAYKVDIQINRQSPDYYELTSGLKEGDKVITSSYETYGTNEVLVLKK